jgi:repressor of nif and glnA expression
MKREYGEFTTLETRHDAHEAVNKNLRYEQILEILDHPMTAKEIAVEMYKRGYVGSDDRNHASPRLTEMALKGIVEPVGKRRCVYTGRTVTVWDMTPITRDRRR